MRVAVAQIDIELFDIEKNIKKHIEFIQEAKRQKVDLLVFPELSLSGYFLDDKIFTTTINLHEDTLSRLKDECKDIRVMFGFPNEKRNFLVYNSVATAFNGEIEYVYDKNNLPNYHHFREKAIFTPSYETKNFAIDEQWMYSVLICADMWDPSLVHEVMQNGANLLISPFNSAFKGDVTYSKGWQSCFDFYSMMYGTYIVGANRVGSENGYKFFGNSVIMDPYGEILVKAKELEEDFIFADISYEHIRKARFKSPNLKNTF